MSAWTEGQVQAEVPFHDDPALARAVVEAEYADCPPPIACPHCGSGTAHYKATIGAMKCTTCGELAWEDGEPI
jgi:hypothetical protein